MRRNITETLVDRLSPGWRERMARKKSLWNQFGFLTALFLTFYFWYVLIDVALIIHSYVFHEHRVAAADFIARGHPNMPWSMAMMFFPLFVPAFIGALLVSNCVLWLIPVARRAMDVEAAGNKKMTFKGASSDLIRVGGIVFVICMALSLWGNMITKKL